MATTADDCGSLEPLELELVDHVERGELLDLAGDMPVDEAAMRLWDASRTVRACRIRDIARGRLATNADPHGLRLRGARISGRLDLENITSKVALEFYDCLFEQGLIVRDATLPGLAITRCVIEHPSDPPLNAAGLTAIKLDLEGSRISGHSNRGTVRLVGAHLGEFGCEGTSLRNDDGPALDAERLHVDQDVFLTNRFNAVGAREDGAIRFDGAHVGGRLNCAGADLRNDTGPALRAANLRVEQDVHLSHGFIAVGAGKNGAVQLIGAHLGQLNCTGASIHNDTGPALDAERLRIDQNMFLRDEIDQNGSLRNKFEAIGGGNHVVVDLTDTKVSGSLVFDPSGVKHRTDPQDRLRVDGLVYAGLPWGPSPGEWLRLLGEGTSKYAAQPYQHLAAAHRAIGHDSQARQVLMTQRRDQIHRRVLTNPAERAWARLTGLTLGYGYQPWRALLGLLATITAAVLLAIILGGHGGLAEVHNPPTPAPGGCSVVDRVGVGLDLGTPLIATGARTRCDTTTSSTGQVLTMTGWVLRLLAWAFATLFIAGFTSAVRKT